MDRPGRPHLRLGLLAAGLLVVGMARLLGRSPTWVERLYADGFGEWIGRVLSKVSSVYPWSLAELIAVVLVIALAVLGRAGLRRARSKDRAWVGVLARGTLNLSVVAVLLTATFYVAWGMHYFRLPLDERLGWQGWMPAASEPIGPDELERLCRELVEIGNHSRERVEGDPELGGRQREWDRAIERGYALVGPQLGLPQRTSPRAKPLLSSPVWSRLGIAGIYIPWTAEASYNRALPWSEIPSSIAHEKAHLRGIAAEGEAGFVGFLASIAAPDADVRYSAWLDAQMRLLNELYRVDRAAAESVAQERSPTVRADVEAIRSFWAAQRGPVQRAGERFNDSYLKLQGVDDGTASYARASRLLVSWARRNGGSFFESDDPRRP